MNFSKGKSKGVSSLLVVFGFIIVAGGLLVVNTAPLYLTETHKTILYAVIFLTGGLAFAAGFLKT